MKCEVFAEVPSAFNTRAHRLERALSSRLSEFQIHFGAIAPRVMAQSIIRKWTFLLDHKAAILVLQFRGSDSPVCLVFIRRNRVEEALLFCSITPSVTS